MVHEQSGSEESKRKANGLTQCIDGNLHIWRLNSDLHFQELMKYSKGRAIKYGTERMLQGGNRISTLMPIFDTRIRQRQINPRVQQLITVVSVQPHLTYTLYSQYGIRQRYGLHSREDRRPKSFYSSSE